MAKDGDRFEIGTVEKTTLPFGIGPSYNVTTVLDRETGKMAWGAGSTKEESVASALEDLRTK